MARTAAFSGPAACISTRSDSQKHYFAAKTLYKAGVWIGHLHDLTKSYQGLPSFAELKSNCKRMVFPFPPPAAGKPVKERFVVCRGCYGPTSRLFAIREIGFTSSNKVVIMPLRSEEETQLFCILIQQSTDRSLPTLQGYRPYEIEGHGTTFTNSFLLSGLRNSSHSSSTIDSIRLALDPPRVQHDDSVEPSPAETLPLSPRRSSSVANVIPAKRQVPVEDDVRDASGAPNAPYASIASDDPIAQCDQEANPKRCRTQQLTPTSRGVSAQPGCAGLNNSDANTRPTERCSTPASGLSKDQSHRIRFNWTAVVEGTEYEFTAALDECETWARLLDQFRADADQDPDIMAILDRTKVWRLMYQLPAGPKKAFTVRNELGFERLLFLLAQSPSLADTSNLKVEIEVRTLLTGVVS